MIDWLNPSDEVVEARNVGRQDRQGEIGDCEQEIEFLSGQRDALLAACELAVSEIKYITLRGTPGCRLCDRVYRAVASGHNPLCPIPDIEAAIAQAEGGGE